MSLSSFATDASDQARLEALGSDEVAYAKALHSSKGLAWIDLYENFESLRGSVTLETLLKHIPPNHPRPYSIASSGKIVGKGKVELCVGRLMYTTGEGEEVRFRVGVCSNFMTLVPEGTEVVFRIVTCRSFHLPTDTRSDLFMGQSAKEAARGRTEG